MSDYSNIIQSSFGQQNSALPQTVGNIDEDPDRAQRAMDLAKATGVPSTAIFGDLDEFERQHKAMMASDIVANNPHLGDFVQSNPMVPKIANDDYGNLDSVSQKTTAMSLPMRVLRAPEALAKIMFPGDPLERFKEGGPLGSWALNDDNVIKNYPLLGATAAGLATPIEVILRGLAGTQNTVADAAANLVGAVDPSLGRDLGAMVQSVGMTGRTGLIEHPIYKVAEGIGPLKHYIENGREPPPSVSADYDTFRAERNAEDVERLNEVVVDAQQSLVRERNPDLFRGFIAQHTDAEIGLGGDAVSALYGDKVPLPDDGLLGWVPNIAEQLEAARKSGDDIHVPLADWVTRVDPAVMKALADDIRVRPGAITAREAQLATEANAVQPPPIPLPEEVPAVRAASALEPLLSVGDRKLKLERLEEPVGTRFGRIDGFHDFSLNDENGQPIGTLNLSEQKGGKELYVEMINGINGLGPRDFGPALMRSLLRQIKENFPNAETITGHRVSGAREKAGVEMTATAPVVRLDKLDDAAHNQFREALEGGQWESYSPNIQGYIKPDAARTQEDRQLIDIVNEELDRIVPKKVAIQGVDTAAVTGNIEGQRPGEAVRVGGAYIRYRDSYPLILYALDGENALGAARHEAIHHLRQYGFFKEDEWQTLETQALAGGWLTKYGIDRRYPNANPSLKLEESIAEAYRDWANGAKAPTPEIHGLFERMKAFFTAIKDRISALLGKEATWEDIFQKVDTGEVGAREGSKPLDARAFDEKLSVPDEPSRIFERANALGMTVEQYKRYDKLIAERHTEDVAAAERRIGDAQRRVQTKEWKANRAEMRKQVAEDINLRPDIAADNYFADGMLYGKQVERVKLGTDFLTEQQRAQLPRDYYNKVGMAPDDLAGLFGFPTGEALIQHLTGLSEMRRNSGMRSIDFKRRVIDIETGRQMRLKHGVLDQNIMDAVKEQVVSETQLNLVHEETLYHAIKANEPTPLTKDAVDRMVNQEFEQSKSGNVSSDRYLAAVRRADNAIQTAQLKQDWAGAFREAQRKSYALHLAKDAIAFEKEASKFDKLVSRFSKPFDPKTSRIDADYSLFIRNILSKLEVPNGMRPDGMVKALGESGYKDLGDFVDKINELYSLAGIELPVADFLRDPAFHKPLHDLTVDEFHAVHDSIAALNKFGRDIERVNVEGATADRKDWVKQAGTQLANKFKPQDFGATGKPGVVRTYFASLMNMETLFGRFDGRDPNGLFTKMFVHPGARAANNKDVLTRAFSKDLQDAGSIADPTKKLVSPLVDPRTGAPLTDFTRSHLATIISNMGNEYNWKVFTKGWKIDPDVLWKWVEANATKEDFDRAQAIGKIFDRAKAQSDVVYKQMYGVSPESIQVRPFEMYGKQYDGWYHPIIHDPIRSNIGLKQSIDPSEVGAHNNFWPSTSNAYTKRRTGYVDVISLDQSMTAIKLNQMLHDIAFREFVHESAKITRDRAFQQHISTYYGPEYKDAINTWLERIAGNASYNGEALGLATRLSNQMRSNVISTYIAFNPTTIQKHGFTAAVMSAKEVGAGKFTKAFGDVAADSFRNAVHDLFGKSDGLGESLWQFVKNNSEEIQRRERNFEDTLGGQADIHLGKSTLKQRIIQLGSKGVAYSDMLSAVPTWLAKYREVLGETGDAGHATDLADAAVRRAHGSTAITNQPTIVSHSNPLSPWLTSIYGFFGTNMQRRFEIAHDINDAYKLAKDGEIAEAAKAAPGVMSSIFTYVIWPGLVEEAVTAQFMDDKSKGGLLGHALAFALGTMASTFIGIRDLAYGLTHNQDPHAGLIESPLHDVSQLLRDVKKHRPFDKQNAGTLVQNAITVFGDFTGKGPKHIGQAARYGIDVLSGQQKPKSAVDVLRGIASGQQQRKVVQ